MEVELVVNGRHRRVEVDGGEALLFTLRERLGLTGTKDGCSEGECGACTVLLDGRPVDSCLFPAAAAEGRGVLTVEGLAAVDGTLSPLQAAFVADGAVQCGFCTPGLLMTLTALLAECPHPDADDVRAALSGNLCRCTGYAQVVEATLSAAGGQS